MKTVLCYGDSNTWGYDPATRARYPPHVRWTGVLATRLAAGRQRLPFFDAGAVIASSEKDGIPFDADEHRQLGEALPYEVRRLVG